MWRVKQFVIQVIILCVVVGTTSGTQHINSRYARAFYQGLDTRCTLPPHPAFGKWTIFDDSSDLSPGQLVSSRTVLEINCDENYNLDGEDTSVCLRGKWKPSIGRCLRTCPPINSTLAMTVTCTYNDKELTPCTGALEGTIARFRCADFYEDQGLESQPLRICAKGAWGSNLPKCVPRCGKPASARLATLIIGGTVVERGQYPWQVAIYMKRNKELICGGTLLNQRVISTAAHCITGTTGKLQPKEDFIVAVGKYYRQFDHHEETAQFSSIYKMYVPRKYKGYLQNYLGDIGIIVTTKTFELSVVVQPVCVQWDAKHHEFLTNPTKIKKSYVSGWGYTSENKNSSKVLQYLEVPVVTDEVCHTNIPEDEEEYITDDKFCAGFTNSSNYPCLILNGTYLLVSGRSACKGDSGGGLVCKYNQRFYIIGIVSVSPAGESGGCNSQHYTLYTNFSYHIEDFILEKEARFRPSESNVDIDNRKIPDNPPLPPTTTQVPLNPHSRKCILPNHPDFGKWTVSGSTRVLQPGMSVDAGTDLKLECNEGFKTVGQMVVHCVTNRWSSGLGRCLKVCPPRFSTPTLQVTCTHNKKVLDNCTEPSEGTIAKFECAPFHEDQRLKSRPIHICQNGEWDQEMPQCQPVCGERSIKSRSIAVNGTQKRSTNYPWHASIYNYGFYGPRHALVCSGTLLSQKVVLTAALCVTKMTGELHTKKNFTVAVGKMHRKFNESGDIHAQFSGVSAMFVYERYEGNLNQSQSLFGNIAVLIMQKSFDLSANVLPVCVDAGQKYKYSSNQYAYLSSWGMLNRNSSVVMKEKKVSLMDLSTCRDTILASFAQYVTTDKLCGGTVETGTQCNIDYGSGLVQKRDGRYYILGIATLSPMKIDDKDYECNDDKITIYTDVSKYITNFISIFILF